MSPPLSVPGPKTKLPWGFLFTYRRDPIGFLMGLAHKYGDIAYFKIGSENVFLLNDPEMIKDVLVTHHQNFIKGRGLEMTKRLLGEGLLTSEGEFHQRQRRLAQPAFHRQRIASYGTVMTGYCVRLQERWKAGTVLDVAREMTRLTLAIVGKTLFDTDLEAEAEEISEALTSAMELWSAFTLPFAELLEKFPLPSFRRFQKARDRLDSIILRMIKERRASGVDRGDLLSMMLLAQDEEGGGGHMTDMQLRDEAMTILLAGHETTANALTWTWYLLSQHPEAEEKVHAELDRVLAGRLPTVTDLARLPYTEMVLIESMRLYPPAWIVGRRALDDYEIYPYLIPARSLILISQYVTHHDPRCYPEPFHFDPQRWAPEVRVTRPRFAYFPFGGGPRQCIGESFAWMETLLTIATLAQSWRMRLVPGHPIELQPRITLRPKHGMAMTLEARRSGYTA
jgi:cytochrome P450